jgi:hypothetical protein
LPTPRSGPGAAAAAAARTGTAPKSRRSGRSRASAGGRSRPRPRRATRAGVGKASWAISNAPSRSPGAPGSKTSRAWQVPRAGSVGGQSLSSRRKSPTTASRSCGSAALEPARTVTTRSSLACPGGHSPKSTRAGELPSQAAMSASAAAS